MVSKSKVYSFGPPDPSEQVHFVAKTFLDPEEQVTQEWYALRFLLCKRGWKLLLTNSSERQFVQPQEGKL